MVWVIVRSVCARGDTCVHPTDPDEAVARQLWLEPPPGLVVVAADASGQVVGSAKMGPNRMGPGRHVATASFMVAEDERSDGIGRMLGRFAIDWATAQGYRAMRFNAVVEANRPGLWRSLGFRIVGTVPEAFLHPTEDYVGLHVMHRRLP